MSGEIVIGAVLGMLGALLLACAAWLVARTQRHLRTALRRPGRVVGHRSIRTDTNRPHQSPVFAPIVEYELGGRMHTYTSSAGAGTREPAVGSQVMVFVQRDDPDSAMLSTFGDRWLLPVLMGGFGALCVAIAALVWSMAP